MQQIRFYTDTHIAKSVAVQLRDYGVDVLRCEEVGMAEASDVEHLEYAARENRIIITNDADFTRLDAEWKALNKSHTGIMYCLAHVQGKKAVGIIVKHCLDYYEMIVAGAGTIEDDIVNRIIYIR